MEVLKKEKIKKRGGRPPDQKKKNQKVIQPRECRGKTEPKKKKKKISRRKT